jgi:3'-phosphoadenosine 5'-phosphosulfate sulfotransferase (PAPS reductase)/FAD synthetase
MWCRSKLKYPIRNAAVEKLYPHGVSVACEGSRWYENDFRRSHPRVNVITNITGYRDARQIWAHALADWNGFDIWSYIHSHDLPVNPLYELGYQRTTCWSCPLVNPFHLMQSRRQHPELWNLVADVDIQGFEGAGRDLLPTETPLSHGPPALFAFSLCPGGRAPARALTQPAGKDLT